MAQQYGFPAEEKVGTATDGVIEGACENVVWRTKQGSDD
jgi:hypothetical protein